MCDLRIVRAHKVSQVCLHFLDLCVKKKEARTSGTGRSLELHQHSLRVLDVLDSMKSNRHDFNVHSGFQLLKLEQVPTKKRKKSDTDGAFALDGCGRCGSRERLSGHGFLEK